MFRDTSVLLNYEARKKPHIAAMMAQLPSMTAADIDALKVPKWIREAFRAIKRAAPLSLKYEEISSRVTESFTPDPKGMIRRWRGTEMFIALDKGELLIREGQLVWFPDTGGMWIESIFVKRIDPKVDANTVPVGVASKSEYIRRYKERLAGLDAPSPSPPPSTDETVLGRYGVRISRLG